MKKNKKKQELLDALWCSSGVIIDACDAVGLSVQMFYYYRKSDPDFAKQVKGIKQLEPLKPANTQYYETDDVERLLDNMTNQAIKNT